MKDMPAEHRMPFDFAPIRNGVKRWALFGFLFVVTDLVMIQAVRAFWVWRTIDAAARLAVRYGITGTYDTAYCANPCESESAQDVARLRSIYDLLHQELSKASITEASTQNSLRLTVCSDRLGFQYVSQASLCIPRNDPGDKGDLITVEVSYDYSLGSLWGRSLGTIPLRATHVGIVEAFRDVPMYTSLEAIGHLHSPDRSTRHLASPPANYDWLVNTFWGVVVGLPILLFAGVCAWGISRLRWRKHTESTMK
jgi:hypothetical protein